MIQNMRTALLSPCLTKPRIFSIAILCITDLVVISNYLQPLSATQRCNSFGTICGCVCVRVRACVSLSKMNGQTCKLEFRRVGQVDDYLGQDRRSRSKVRVTRSKTFLMGISINLEWDVCSRKEMNLPRKRRRNMTLRPMRGVLKAYMYAVSL